MLNETPSSRKRSSSSEPARPSHSPAHAGRHPASAGQRRDGRPSRDGRNRHTLRRPDKQEVSAGGIIYRQRGNTAEIFFIKDAYERWTFPKGHQELGETLAQTAVREIKEETGLTGLRLVAPIGKRLLRFRREVGVIHKTVHYFLFEAPLDAKEKFRTRAEVGENHELIQEGKWVPMRQAFTVSSYKNSDQLLARAFRMIGGELGKGRKPQGAPAFSNAPRPRHRRRRWNRGRV